MSPGPGGGGGPGPQPIFSAAPSSEPLSEFLVRRERELTQQIDALRGQIVPKEQEREQIRTAMRALGLLTEAPSAQPASPLDALLGTSPASVLATALSDGSILAIPPSNSGHTPPSLGELLNPTPLTIKQMALAALRDHFRQGATPAELRDYMKTAYGRDVDRNSISPQLARLRDQGAVQQHNDGKWSITRGGRWYDHPTSFNASKDEPAELSEESSDEDIARWIEARALEGKVSIRAAREHLSKRKG